MDTENYMVLVDGEDKSEAISSFYLEQGRYPKYKITYRTTQKEYTYKPERVEVLPPRGTAYPNGRIVMVGGKPVLDAKKVVDFGAYCRVLRGEGPPLSCRSEELAYRSPAPAAEKKEPVKLPKWKLPKLFAYFREIAGAVGLVHNGENILDHQYEMISGVNKGSVLASYFDVTIEPQKRTPPPLIYPFGLNQSQKRAVERALSSQVSVVQGPPGTGKTQTILNIIANVVYQGQTVAVVSNNNSAVQNVAEKLEKKGLDFLIASLGNQANVKRFLENQSGAYPAAVGEWGRAQIHTRALEEQVRRMTEELDGLLAVQNRIAQINQEILELRREWTYYRQYCRKIFPRAWEAATALYKTGSALKFPGSQEVLALCELCGQYAEEEPAELLPAFRDRFGSETLEALGAWDQCVPFLWDAYYQARRLELYRSRAALGKKLTNAAFSAKMEKLSRQSLQLLLYGLGRRYGSGKRPIFDGGTLRAQPDAFTREYPVVLSTAYSILGGLGENYMYDYLIIDEASQVDLATGVLAFACARNLVIVGDRQQLPYVCGSESRVRAEAVWKKYLFPEAYHYAAQSLLSSALLRWTDAPVTLLREHYRCHPLIIGFCNRKFYHGELIAMTRDGGESGVLSLYPTAPDGGTKKNMNQTQIDVIKDEILPELERRGCQSVGIIAPYRSQVEAIEKQISAEYEAATVHQFQGREREAIVLSSVDNVLTPFVDDPNMLNVAVSRAIKSLSVIVTRDPNNDSTNYGDLARYIRYYSGGAGDGAIYPVFALLHRAGGQYRRTACPASGWTGLYYALWDVIEKLLDAPDFSGVGCTCEAPLPLLIRDYSRLESEEAEYLLREGPVIDFLLFRWMDRSPVGAIWLEDIGGDGGEMREAKRMQGCILQRFDIPLFTVESVPGDPDQEETRNAFRERAADDVKKILESL